MYIADHGVLTPEKPAVIAASSGQILTFGDLNERSNRLTQYLFAIGLRRGDHIAVLMENNLSYMIPIWAALRSGLHVTTVNRFLKAEEAAYIVNDCGAKAIIASSAMAEIAEQITVLIPACDVRLMVDGTIAGWESFEDKIGASPAVPLETEWLGELMLYSSGTTGQPKGVLRPLKDKSPKEHFIEAQRMDPFSFSSETVFLSPAPLYHAAPLMASINVLAFGGTMVMMERFDAEQALALIAKYRVTHSQWVPTMFIRMLKLPESVRMAHDLSSHRFATHAAAPCPVEAKHQMIEWWGPIIFEAYGGTEGMGMTFITSDEWLAHPGSVGRAADGVIHICDEDGNELPPGEPGLVYFEITNRSFEYHNDPDKTKEAFHPFHPNWSAMGDVGYLDEDGYLYLTDRKAFMIISGGVNIYPQAVENALITHPKVGDVAVIGVPDEEMGESVKAIIEPADGVTGSDELAAELIAYVRNHVAHYMAPRSVDFIDELPRLPTGKLYKKALRDKYWM